MNASKNRSVANFVNRFCVNQRTKHNVIKEVLLIFIKLKKQRFISQSFVYRDYALHEQSTGSVNNNEFTSSLAVGQVCCAKFSVDQCWYRACVSGLNDKYGGMCYIIIV